MSPGKPGPIGSGEQFARILCWQLGFLSALKGLCLWVPCKPASAASPAIKAGSSLGHVIDGDEEPGCILKWQHRHQSLPPVLCPGGFQAASGNLKILNPVGGPITAVSHHPSIHTLVEFITSQESPDLSVSSSTQLKPFQISGLSGDLFLKS